MESVVRLLQDSGDVVERLQHRRHVERLDVEHPAQSGVHDGRQDPDVLKMESVSKGI